MGWQRTTNWRPARTGTASTQSGSGPVQHQETGELGYAKTAQALAYREKVASDLAALIGVPVPEVRLDKVEGSPEWHAISIVFGSESVDVPLLRERLKQLYESPAVKDAFRRSSGLLALHAWLATEDLKDEHVVVSANRDGTYDAAAIDFAYSMNVPADGGDVRAPDGPPTLVGNVDGNVIRDAVERIERTTDEKIRAVVDGLPDELLSRAGKDQLVSALCARRGKIREAVKQKGWLS